MWISTHFGTKELCMKTWYSFRVLFFWDICPKKYIRKYLKQFSKWRLNKFKNLHEFWAQNVIIPAIPNIPHVAKCLNCPNLCTTENVSIFFRNNINIGNVITVWNRKLYMKTLYGLKIFMNYDNFSCLIFWAKMS